MQLISKFNKVFRFLLCVIDIYSKYAWVIPLNYKKGITVTNAFQKILHESNRKPNKIWVGKGSKFYNRSMKSFLQNNNIKMYSMHNEWKSFIAERFVRILKKKIYIWLLISKDAHIDKLDNIVNKYNNTHHSTIKIKPLNTYINSSKGINDEDPKFKIGDIVRISKYKNIFEKCCTSN